MVVLKVEGSIPEKYSQFHLVLEFILEPSWNCEMVAKAIKSRTKRARYLSMAYELASKFLQSSPSAHIVRVR